MKSHVSEQVSPSRLSRRQFIQTTAVMSVVSLQDPQPKSVPGPFTSLEKPPVYITDLGDCQPQSSLSSEPRSRRWRKLPYETETLKGVLLAAGQNTEAPEITYPLQSEGWHAIHIGLLSRHSETRLQVRLSGDSSFSLMTHTHRPEAAPRDQIDEFFWKFADLTNQDIVFRQLPLVVLEVGSDALETPGAWIAYIKLVPLSAAETQTLEEERAQTETKRLFAHNDAWSFTFSYEPESEAEIHREIEPLRDSDFSRLYWEAGMGDRMYYPTQIGLMATDEWIEDPYRAGDLRAARTWQTWEKKGIDPFQVALDYTHELGLEFHAAYRVAGFYFPPPEDLWNKGGIYENHPEWRAWDRQGRRTPRLSYAYEGLRRFVISLLKEMAQYPVDGICLLFNRRPPVLEYEPPLVTSFEEEYGRDPRQLDPKDQRWLKHRAGFLTQFMREVRQAMSEVEKESGRENAIEISAIVMGSEEENLFQSIDLRYWVQNELVDTIIPYTSVEGLRSSADSWTDPADAEFFLKLVEGTDCTLALNLMPRRMAPEVYLERAHALYEAGVEHLFTWDTNTYQRADFSPGWQVLRNLGHRKQISEWVRSGSPRIDRPGKSLHKLGDWDLSYETPG